MEIFLIIAALIFLVFGSLLLLSPAAMEKIANFINRLNRAVFTMDVKIPTWRRPLGIILLALTIFCWYVALVK